MTKDNRTAHSDSIMTTPEAAATESGRQAYWDVLITNFVSSCPYYNTFVSITALKFTNSVPWMGIRWNGECLELFLNVGTLTKESPVKQLGMLKHEYAHYFLRHLGSRGRRLNEAVAARSKGASDRKIHEMANVLLDLEINSVLGKGELPKSCAFPVDHGLPDGLLAEEYLALITQEDMDHIMGEKTVSLNLCTCPSGGKGKKGEYGDGDGEGDGKVEGEGEGEGTPRGLKDFMGPDKCDISIDGVPMDELAECDIAERLKRADADARQRGSTPGGFDVLLGKLRPASVQWKGMFVETAVGQLRSSSSNPTFARLNRRGLPSPGKIYKTPPRLFVCLDTSGSVSENQLVLLASEIVGLRRHASLIYVIVCDAGVHDAYVFNGTFRPLKGGGGSSFIPAFEHIAQKYPGHGTPNVIMLLTDGDTDVPKDAVKDKVIWVLSDGDRNVPYGKKIVLTK